MTHDQGAQNFINQIKNTQWNMTLCLHHPDKDIEGSISFLDEHCPPYNTFTDDELCEAILWLNQNYPETEWDEEHLSYALYVSPVSFSKQLTRILSEEVVSNSFP
jgi:hypothetical protein